LHPQNPAGDSEEAEDDAAGEPSPLRALNVENCTVRRRLLHFGQAIALFFESTTRS
jgi:hypothetical protein